MTNIFNDAYRECLGAEERCEEERKRIIKSIFCDPIKVKEGLLKVLERAESGMPFPNGTVEKNGEELTAVHMGMFLIRANKSGRVEIDWGRGEIGVYQDERFKKLYSHLEKVYEIFHEDKLRVEPIRYPIKCVELWGCKHPKI